MKLKNIVAVPLALTLLSTSTISIYADNKIEQHWAANSLNKFVSSGILVGENGNLRQDEVITRAEFAALIDRIMKYPDEADNGYIDVPDGKWYKTPMLKAVDAGIMGGGDGKLRPLDPITREEVASVMCRAFYFDNELAEVNFSDDKNISSWAKDSVYTLKAKGIIRGKSENKYVPKANITRAEAISMLDRASGEIISGNATDKKHIKGNLIVNSPDIVLDGIKVDGDIIITPGAGNVNIANVDLGGRLVVSGGKVDVSSKVENLVVKNRSDLNLKGAKIAKLEISEKANGMKLNLDEKSEVSNSVFNSEKVEVSGTGRLNNLSGKSADRISEAIKKSKTIEKTSANNATEKNNSGGGSSTGGGNSTQTVSSELKAAHVTQSLTKLKGLGDGSLKEEVIVKISDKTTAKFAKFKSGNVDAISSATTVKTLPKGLVMNLERIDDKTLKVKFDNASEKRDNQTVKLLLLPEMFIEAKSVENGGIYCLFDLEYNKSNENNASNIINKKQSQIINVEQVHYGVVVLQKGNLDNYKFELNGKTVIPTPINDSKDIVKFEINPNQVANLEIISKSDKNDKDSIKLGEGSKAFTGIINKEAPSKVMASGPVSIFDYHLNNYDKDGNVRKYATKTTFNTVSEGEDIIDKTLPLLKAEKTKYGQDVVIKFDENAKQWQENIYAIKSDGGGSRSSRQPLQFEIEDGKIIISSANTQFYNNGVHNLVISANGYNDAKVKIEIVKPAGEINLTSNFNYWANQDLLFELSEFNYAIENPIYEVILDGEVLQGDCIDYHIVSNLVRLERDAHSKLNKGNHTLVVKAYGYEDFEKTFTLEKAPNGHENPVWGSEEHDDKLPEVKRTVAIDVMSKATGSGGSSSGGASGGSSGGGAIRANVIFEFDLIANARILSALDKETAYSKNVIMWWNSLLKDALIVEDGKDKLISYVYYKNNAGQEKDGQYQTFKKIYENTPNQKFEFGVKKHPAIYWDRAYNVKNMLEDGLLGETYRYFEVSAKESPKVSVVDVKSKEDIVIEVENKLDSKAWMTSIEKIMIGHAYLKYELKENELKIIIPANENPIVNGKNTIEIYSEAFKPVKLTVNVSKKNESEYKVTKDSEGNIYIAGLSNEFSKAIKGMSINGKYLFNDSQLGANKGGYEINGDTLMLRKEIFKDSDGKQKTLSIVADGFEAVYVKFTPNKSELTEEVLGTVPDYIKLSTSNTYLLNSQVSIDTGDLFSGSTYKLNEVYVKFGENSKLVKDSKGSFGSFVISGEEFKSVGDYEITLKAKGYKDKTFTIEVGKNLAEVPNFVKTDRSNIEFGNDVKLILSGIGGSSEYANKFDKATLLKDGSKINEFTKANISKGTFETTLELKNLEIGIYSLQLNSEGYKEKTIEFTVNGKKVPNDIKLVKETSSGLSTTSESTIELDEAKVVKIVVASFGKTYLDALQEIEVNGTSIPKNSFEIKEKQKIGYSDYTIIEVPKDKIAEGTNVIILKATNYQDKTFNVNVKIKEVIQEIPKATEEPKAVEEIKAVEEPKVVEEPKTAEESKSAEESKVVEEPKAPEESKSVE